MLTDELLDRAVAEALKLGRYQRRLDTAVTRHQTDRRRANELWVKRVNEFRTYLRELSHVPMPALPVAPSDVGQPDKAQTKDRPPGL